MKTLILLLTASILISTNLSAQFFENFDQNTTGLSSNCWMLEQINYSTTSSDVITGTVSAYTNPPTSGSGERTIATPFLNVTSTSLSVSFKYKTSSKIAGQATRTIDIGLRDKNGVFTSLQLITMDKNSPTSVLTHNATYSLATTGVYRLELRIGGATGDGNSRVIFDDLSVGASAYYGPVNHCNPAAVAINDTDSLNTISTATGNVLLNDQFPGDNESYTAKLVAAPLQGTVVLNADGTYAYTPPAGFTGGTITFTYSVSDNGFSPSSSNVATVTIKYAALLMLPVNSGRPVSVDHNKKNELQNGTINIRQNPVNTRLELAYAASSKQEYTVHIYSLSGAVLHQENKLSSTGTNVVSIDVQQFAKGMYVVMISNGNTRTAAKFIKR